jgi:hypothetical protein
MADMPVRLTWPNQLKGMLRFFAGRTLEGNQFTRQTLPSSAPPCASQLPMQESVEAKPTGEFAPSTVGEIKPLRQIPEEDLEHTLSFLDGYLFREMVAMLRSDGPEASGLYSFYQARIEEERSALSWYDYILVKYLMDRFRDGNRYVVHAGIGLGTLTAVLSYVGFRIAGVELDEKRYLGATRLRSALVEICPEAAALYSVTNGEFPTVVKNTGWVGPRSVLVFTNCGAAWSNELTDDIIGLMPKFGDVILDTRLFGIVRDEPEERVILVRRIEAHGLRGLPIPGTSELNAFYYHFQRQEAAA